jgi:hypothetical protein
LQFLEAGGFGIKQGKLQLPDVKNTTAKETVSLPSRTLIIMCPDGQKGMRTGVNLERNHF